MTKKNKVIFRLLGVFVVLLLVSLCLLGSTFARYTSSGSGTGSVKVAQWSISDTNGGTVAFASTDGLSPNRAAYESSQTGTITGVSDTAAYTGYDDYGNRVNTTYLKTIAVISNGGDVDAYVKINESEITKSITYSADIVKDSENDPNLYYDDTGETTGSYDGSDTDTGYNISDITARFSIVIDYGSATDGTSDNYAGYYKVASKGSITISAYVIWTSADAYSSDDNGKAADALDTFIGEYITKIDFNITWTAVQGGTVSA